MCPSEKDDLPIQNAALPYDPYAYCNKCTPCRTRERHGVPRPVEKIGNG